MENPERQVSIWRINGRSPKWVAGQLREAYGIDRASGSLVLWPGDVYSLDEHCVVSHIGPCPPVSEKPHPLAQPAYVSTDHGLYAYYNVNHTLYKADVAAGVWRVVAKGGPGPKCEFAHPSWDSRRDRLIYLDGRHPGVWAYSFAAGKWEKEAVQGGDLPRPHADSTYVAAMDAVLVVCAQSKGKEVPEHLYFYKLAEKKWYSAPSTGDPFGRPNYNGLNCSPFYDPELGLVVRVTARSGWRADVHVMRLVPEKLTLTPAVGGP
jgi:hypothetical protein